MESREAWSFTRTESFHSQQLALKLVKYLEHCFSLLVRTSHYRFLDFAKLIRMPGSLLPQRPDAFPLWVKFPV